MSRPVTRTRILLAKSGVLAAALIVPIFVTTWSAIPLSWQIDEQLPFYELTLAAAHNALFCTMFLAASLACSVWFRTQLMVVAAVGGIGVFQVGIYFVQEIRVASLFRLSDYDVYAPILAGNLPLGPLFLERGVWILLATLALFGAAVFSFRRAEP